MSTEKQEGDFKIKSKPKMKKLNKTEEVTKVNLSQPKDEIKKEDVTKVVIPTENKKEDDAIQIGETKEIPVGESSGDSEKVGEGISKPAEEVQDEQPILQEITEDVAEEVEEISKEVEEAKIDAETTGKPEAQVR